MAKSKSFFGLRRGSTKTMTYSVLNGVQITKDRVEGGINPRSDGQQSQRAIFANAVKFYKHSQKALFKFAFEDKRTNESDYNAFMRHNVSRSLILNNESVNDPNFPALGNGWLLTFGSLKPAEVKFIPREDRLHFNRWAFSAPSSSGQMSTNADLSQVLIADFDLQEGDIVTSVYITSDYRPNIIGPLSNAPQWLIKQLRVDTSDDTPVDGFALMDGEITMTALFPGFAAAGASVIFSRPIKGEPLKVSTSELVNNDVANDAIAGTYTEGYRGTALSSWGAQEKAILQGSLLADAEVEPYPVAVVSVNGSLQVPASMAIVSGESASAAIQFDRTYTASEDDFTASIDNVGLELGAGGVLNIEVDASVPDGTIFAVMFKGAAIINVAVGAAVLTVDGEDSPLEDVKINRGYSRDFVLTTAGVDALTADDFTTSSGNVTVDVTAADTIRVSVNAGANIATFFSVMFRDQVIISGTVVTVVSTIDGNTPPLSDLEMAADTWRDFSIGTGGYSTVDSDFSTSSANIEVVKNGTNRIRVTVPQSAEVGSEFFVKFHEQTIASGTVTAPTEIASVNGQSTPYNAGQLSDGDEREFQIVYTGSTPLLRDFTTTDENVSVSWDSENDELRVRAYGWDEQSDVDILYKNNVIIHFTH